MDTYNTHEAKTQLSKLLDRVAQGQEIIIAKAGKPVAKLIKYEARGLPRPSGTLRGKIEMAPDFDELPDEIVAAFWGESDESAS